MTAKAANAGDGKRMDRNFTETGNNGPVWLTRLAWVRFAALGLLVVAFLLVKICRAQEVDTGAGPGSQRMVRLSDVEGAVQVVGTDGAAFPQVVENMPLVEGMRVITPADARAEIEFEDGSVARLAPNSEVDLDHLGADGGGYQTQVQVASGLVYLEVRAAQGYSYNVGYGDGSFTPVQNATVRVDRDSQPPVLAVFAGAISVLRAGGTTVQVMVNESLKGDANDPSRYFLTQEIAPDSWDQWNQDRDDIDSQTATQQTTARNDFAGDDGYGWSDLDAYGNWYQVPGAGLMWQPAGYTAGFDPYGNGYWMFYPGRGYVWVSGYQWGWLPYSCGNWRYMDQFGWGWEPEIGCRRYGIGLRGGVNIARGPSGYRYPVRPGVPKGPRPEGPNSGGPHSGGPRPLEGQRVIAVGGGRVGAGGVGNSGALRGGNGFVVHEGAVAAEGPDHSREHATDGGAVVVYGGQKMQPLHTVANTAVSGQNVPRKDYPVDPATHAPVYGRVPPATPAQQPNRSAMQQQQPRSQSQQQSQQQPRSQAPSGGYSAPRYSPPPQSRPSYTPPPAASHATSGGARR